jgi:hypothetical protein
VAGDICHNENLALAVRCIGLVRRPFVGKTNLFLPNTTPMPRRHDAAVVGKTTYNFAQV